MLAFLDSLAPTWQPHPGQREFLLHPARIKVLACGRRWGKTDATAVQILAGLHRSSPTRHLILAPTLDQARLLFDRVRRLLEACEPSERPTVRTTPYPTLRWREHTVMARSGHLGRSLRGNEATDIVVDEAAYVPEELVTEVAMPMLATTNGSLTLISTPHGLNHFYRFFRMGERGEHGVWSRTGPSAESPHVSSAYLDLQRELVSERAYAVEYDAKFIETSGKVFRWEAVEACLVPRLNERPVGGFRVGIDWARYTDSTAIAVVQGTRAKAALVHLESFTALPWREQLDRVVRVLGRFSSAWVVCDATGAQDVLLEELRERSREQRVEGFVFTRPSKQALIDRLVAMFEHRTLALEPDPQLLRELEHFQAEPSGKMGARSGFHDDRVIALALACWELEKPSRGTICLGPRRAFDKS